jgi:high affinity Mn2+ porin
VHRRLYLVPARRPILYSVFIGLAFATAVAAESSENTPGSPAPPGTNSLSQAAAEAPAEPREQTWNWHVQNTDILQYHPSFPARYSGPNSLDSGSEVAETVSLDLYGGVRLWRGGEAHVDVLMWQGFGLSKTLGIEGFPSGEAYRLGTQVPNVVCARLFIRQTIGLGGEPEAVEDDQTHLAGVQDSSHLTITVGKMSAKDIFDNNAYANDPRTQFMNWALVANEAWDYPADSLGYMTGLAAELYLPPWVARYGFFQMPDVSNGIGQDQNYLKAWGMVTEFERRYTVNGHPGVVRFFAYLNSAHMGSYQAALDSPIRPADIVATEAYRYKYGFGLNLEQEVIKNVGAFARLGWSDGQTEAWAFADVDRTASLGLSVKGEFWKRPNDTVGLGGVINGLSPVHRDFFAAGGTGILAGDGALNYALEKVLEVYYDFDVWKNVHVTLDYQYVVDPAYNRDRGPVSVLGARLHWEF